MASIGSVISTMGAGAKLDYYQSVKLLTARDGKPIALGDTVYGEDGKKWIIDAIGTDYVWGRGQHPTQKRMKPEWLAHELPDSAERIAEDAVKLAPSYYLQKRGIECAHGEDPVQLKLDDVVRRCKRLAGEE